MKTKAGFPIAAAVLCAAAANAATCHTVRIGDFTENIVVKP